MSLTAVWRGSLDDGPSAYSELVVDMRQVGGDLRGNLYERYLGPNGLWKATSSIDGYIRGGLVTLYEYGGHGRLFTHALQLSHCGRRLVGAWNLCGSEAYNNISLVRDHPSDRKQREIIKELELTT